MGVVSSEITHDKIISFGYVAVGSQRGDVQATSDPACCMRLMSPRTKRQITAVPRREPTPENNCSPVPSLL